MIIFKPPTDICIRLPTSGFGIDGELVLVVRLAGRQRAALDLDLGGVADLLRTDHDLERRAGDLRALLLDSHQMLTDLPRRERNACRGGQDSWKFAFTCLGKSIAGLTLKDTT